jgi:hypothetical protein
MLYNSLMDSANIKDKKATALFEQYEAQRKHFLEKRLEEVKSSYGLTNEEKNILLGFFNTFERESAHKSNEPYIAHLLSIFKHHNEEDELIKNEAAYKAALGWLRIYWSGAWRQFTDYNKYLLSARFAIIQHKKNEIKERYEAIAIDDLVTDLKEVLPSAEKALGFPILSSYFLKPIIDENGILDLDVKKLKWLKQNNIGEYTKKYIDDFQQLLDNKDYEVDRRLDVWNLPLYLSKNIAVLRWNDRIARFVQRKQDNSPALTYQFFTQVNETTKRGTVLEENSSQILSKEGRIASLIDKSPGTTLSTMEQITKSSLPLLASITSHYLWRWFVEQAHKQHLLDVEQPYKIPIIGGYAKLGQLSGAGESKEAKSRIKKIIDMSSMCNYLYHGKTGTYRGNLLSFEYFEAYGRKSSKLTLTLARPLCPGFVEELPDTNSKYNHQRILIPWVRMPLLVGRNSAHHAPQSSFQLDMLAKMRLRASEIYERGGILLNDEDMLELAKGAKLSPELVDKVIDTWVNEDYLEKIDDCIYMLGKRYPEARESLTVAGELTVKSAEKGRQRKRIRSNRLRGIKK